MKLSLEKTWKNCLDMWKFISKEVEKDRFAPVFHLKETWAATNGYRIIYPSDIRHNCFFCEYAITHNGKSNRLNDITHYCSKCPAVLVDETFSCEGPLAKVEWNINPVEFYKLLVKLNKKRLLKKKK